MHLTRYLINRSQVLVVEAQSPDAVFSRGKRAESDALQMVFKIAVFPLSCWRFFLALFYFPKIIFGWAAVSAGWKAVPLPALEIENAKNQKKIGKKVGFNGLKKGGIA